MRRAGSRLPTPAEHHAVHGGHPHGPSDRDLATFELATLRALAADAGLQAEVAAAVGALQADPVHQLTMRIARRSGRPYSAVAAEWSDDDQILELAQDIIDAEDRVERCPTCRVRPDEVLDPRNGWRPLKRGKWKWVLHTCWFCERGKTAEDSLSEADKERGATYRVAPRGPYDPLIDNG